MWAGDQCLPDQEGDDECRHIHRSIVAAKSPVAITVYQLNLVYSREHSVEGGLDELAKRSMTVLQSEDVMKSAMAAMDKTNTEPPKFAFNIQNYWAGRQRYIFFKWYNFITPADNAVPRKSFNFFHVCTQHLKWELPWLSGAGRANSW